MKQIDGIFYEDDGRRTQFTRFNDSIFAVQNRVGSVGSYMIKGITEECEDSEITEEQIKQLRFVLDTPNRQNQVEKFDSFVTCGQSDEDGGFMMFNTRHGNKVCFGLSDKIDKAKSLRSKSKRFDALFGLTFALKNFDNWIRDNECWGEGEELHTGILKLAEVWKLLLSNTDADLEIDPGCHLSYINFLK